MIFSPDSWIVDHSAFTVALAFGASDGMTVAPSSRESAPGMPRWNVTVILFAAATPSFFTTADRATVPPWLTGEGFATMSLYETVMFGSVRTMGFTDMNTVPLLLSLIV